MRVTINLHLLMISPSGQERNSASSSLATFLDEGAHIFDESGPFMERIWQPH